MKNVITAFKEHKTFKQNRVWDVNTLTFASDTITPPHYADTIEVLLCCDVMGDIYIGGRKYALGGKQVFYIPPKMVHSVFYQKNNGFVKVLKINIVQLKSVLDIEAMLRLENKNLFCLPTYIPCFSEVRKISDTFQHSTQIIEICAQILNLFELLMHHSESANLNGLRNDPNNDNLRKIILWTESHYLRKIPLAEVARLAGYEKHYFCNKFKEMTGISYGNYVNNLRIQQACTLLAQGTPVAAVAESCGYDNTSYFIQLFKKIVGETPKSYVKKLFAETGAM